ncbi:zinc finger protein 615-like [Callorhinchus milii]|uniref:zinc finger protein 615-like n=1 Tax=Callorhinchus milii TaxID=7868 RepID=UPI001C3F685A|nr:zinc finger protein 615-like [Callorhinchus milii]
MAVDGGGLHFRGGSSVADDNDDDDVEISRQGYRRPFDQQRRETQRDEGKTTEFKREFVKQEMDDNAALGKRPDSTESLQDIDAADKKTASAAGDKRHACGQCGFPHFETHTGEKQYVYAVCGKGFAHDFNLNLRVRSHTDEVVRLRGVGRVAAGLQLEPASEVAYGREVVRLRGVREGSAQACNLNLRVRSHTDERSYVCESLQLEPASEVAHGREVVRLREYGKGSAQACNLNLRVRSHTDERPYVCEEYGKGSVQACNLNLRVRSHMDERPYVCEDCGKSFPGCSDMKRHARTHAGERTYVCDECGQGFTQVDSLHVHARKHTGERPYVCAVCGKGFALRRHLQRHSVTHGE